MKKETKIKEFPVIDMKETNLYALSVLFRLPIDELLCGNKKNILGEEDRSSQCRSLQNYFEEVREDHVA